MKRFLSAASLVALGAAVGWLGARGADKAEPLPESVARLVQRMFPDTDVEQVKREARGDETGYGITLRRRADGRAIKLEVRPEVGITDIDESLDPAELPARIRRSLDSSFPAGTVATLRKKSEIRIRYQVDLAMGGKRREVTLSAKGKVLEVDTKD